MAAFASSGLNQISCDIVCEGIETKIVCTDYIDRVFVVITQIDKFGTLLTGNAEPKSDGGKLYQINTLMGKRDDPLLTIYARQILERLSASTDKPLLLAIALKPEGRSTAIFQTILNKLYENCTW